VADVVQQGGQADQSPMMTVNVEAIAHAPRNMEHAERVLESRVRRCRVDEIRHRELPNVAQPLKDM
jgi:hypothetical protein